MNKLDKWLQDWLERSEIPTRMALAEELRISRSAISHWTGKMQSIPKDKLKAIDELYPINLPAYCKITGADYNEDMLY